MRVLLYSFFSQQDKTTGKFRLQSDSGVKLYNYIGRRMLELGWKVDMALPQQWQCADYPPWSDGVFHITYDIAWDNLDRRIQWDPGTLHRIGRCYDLVLTQHQFLPIPLRILEPKLKIVLECGIRPSTAYVQSAFLFPHAWQCADLVHFNSEQLRQETQEHCKRTSVWQFAYDGSVFTYSDSPKTVDVVFPARASVTNYTNHVAFIAAMRGTDFKVVMTDPTSYLRSSKSCPLEWLCNKSLDTTGYLDLLRSSRVVVSLTENGYGGYALREAIAVGCVPVTTRRPEYVELLGDDWPYYAESLDVDSIRAAVFAAKHGGWVNREQVFERLQKSSYASAWSVAKQDLEALLA